MRGKPCGLLPGLMTPRLIPARAGKTSSTGRPGLRSWAHPRACGENLIGLGSDLAATGSSPRVRGKPPAAPPPRTKRRLIPARAGKTPQPHRRVRRPTAHPRACGENPLVDARHQARRGSSPRVRGKPTGGPAVLADGRLIPARAGKTSGDNEMTRRIAAHPRACGENIQPVKQQL